MPSVAETVFKDSPYYFDNQIRLSEGISYVAESKTLFWIDIHNALIHKVTDIEDISTRTVWHASPENYNGTYPFDRSFPERIGAIFPIDRFQGVDEVYFGAKYGIARMQYSTQTWEYVVLYEQSGLHRDYTGLRSNDGNVSPDGDIFIGIMHDFHCEADHEDPKGALLKVNLPRKTCEVVLDKIMIPNAVNWTEDGTKVYFTDSLNFCIYKFPYENGNFVVSKKSLLVDVKKFNPEFESPEPDGSFIDSATGDVVTAVFSTSSVQRYSSNGDLLHKWIFPDTPLVSACTIAQGHMFVTTANEKLNEKQPQGPGGSVLRVDNVSEYMGSSKRNPLI